MSRVRTRATLLAAAASATLAMLPVLTSSPADAAAKIPEVAPYFEPTGVHLGNLQTAVNSHGLKSFTAAFVLGNKCTPTWDDGSTITGTDAKSNLVKKAKTAGATPIISFGGQSGNELAKVCTTTSKLVTAYTGVINKFGAGKIDFDIEGAANINATAVNTRRYQAIKALETKFPKLTVSLTIPVGYSGIETAKADGDGVTFLKLAKAQGARINVVNLMTMDYGDAHSNMGTAATTSATKALAQIKKIWTADTFANIGITPMIGDNDTPGETFSYADAQTVVTFAKNKGVHRLAFWAINRDQSCGAGDQAPGTCTNLAQDPLDYTDAFVS
jgi:hypothetical protein